MPSSARSESETERAPDRPGRTPAPSRGRGRPPGSVSLTPDKADLIVSLIRGGAFDYVAAEAAGVSARTFRDWMARAENPDHGRPATPKIRRFAAEVARARAEARVAAEVTVHQRSPAYWLTRVARSKPDREGWTDPRTAEAEVPFEDTVMGRIQAYQKRKAAERKAAEERRLRGETTGGPDRVAEAGTREELR